MVKIAIYERKTDRIAMLLGEVIAENLDYVFLLDHRARQHRPFKRTPRYKAFLSQQPEPAAMFRAAWTPYRS